MFGKRKNAGFHEFDGAWEPKGYIGPRVEIEGTKLLRLWRNSPVLTTEFGVEQAGDRKILVLAKNELAYEGETRPYATVKECYFENGAITFVDDFPFSGESRDTLYPTMNSRYGNVTIVSEEVLPLLQGTWVEDGSDARLIFRGNKLSYGYDSKHLESGQTIIAVRPNGDWNRDCVYIINEDPSKSGVGYYADVCYKDGRLTACIPVCDAPALYLTFHKKA